MDIKELKLGAGTNTPLDGGMNIAYTESSISMSQSPLCQNINADDRGSFTTRKGQAYVYQNSLGVGSVNGIYGDYKDMTLFAHGTNIYKQISNFQPTVLYQGVNNNPVCFFIYNSIIYILDGSKMLYTTGTEVKEVVAYIPTITTSRSPDGSASTLLENLNLITGQFKESFSAKSNIKTYKLSYTSLDSIDKVTVNNIERTDITKDLTNGTITFTGDVVDGTNNVIIQAKKESLNFKSNIFKCTKAIEYNGNVWLTGNIEFPNKLFRSKYVLNETSLYFPSLAYSLIGNDDEAITGFSKLYDKLIIFKEESIHFTSVTTTPTGDIMYPINLLNAKNGCDIPHSIQLVKNNPVFCNTKTGVNIIVSTMVEGEKNVLNVSDNINGTDARNGLLQNSLTSLKKAVSYDFKNKYYICVDDKCYVWDYSSSFSINKPNELIWFYYTNIKASYFYNLNDELRYAHNSIGQLVKFIEARNDFGIAIKSLWTSKLIDFGVLDRLKDVLMIYFVVKPNSMTKFNLRFYNENGDIQTITQISPTKSFNWTNFNWSRYNWSVYRFPPTILLKQKMKKISYFQLEISCNDVNDILSILNICVKYKIGKKKK